jgi:hypothetical protein
LTDRRSKDRKYLRRSFNRDPSLTVASDNLDQLLQQDFATLVDHSSLGDKLTWVRDQTIELGHLDDCHKSLVSILCLMAGLLFVCNPSGLCMTAFVQICVYFSANNPSQRDASTFIGRSSISRTNACSPPFFDTAATSHFPSLAGAILKPR